MAKTIISSLSVALVTGLVFLAYTNPSAYGKIGLWVALIVTSINFLFFVWSLGAASIPRKPKNNPMSTAVKSMGLWFIFMTFLAALYFLPIILEGVK